MTAADDDDVKFSGIKHGGLRAGRCTNLSEKCMGRIITGSVLARILFERPTIKNGVFHVKHAVDRNQRSPC
ncbi:hypothetical protein DM47_1132 [Burkholderia mallei]|nr:hypothetical protein DM75_2029 [Burkholderia mallei]KGD11885.1 hypothetical protein DO70_2974 [Burkholderia pseudomallei]KGS22970.1 hypothetical protein X989_2877 [Burkholderia pseudomallei MSHR4378]KOS74482.1 hypothetical protein DM46_668 [Burkholderia mallei]KOS98681.1 hypothetical protein DM50_750 [Burkholderia mallei]